MSCLISVVMEFHFVDQFYSCSPLINPQPLLWCPVLLLWCKVPKFVLYFPPRIFSTSLGVQHCSSSNQRNIVVSLKDWRYFFKHKKHCPQIFIKHTLFEDNDIRRLPMLRCCSFLRITKTMSRKKLFTCY